MEIVGRAEVLAEEQAEEMPRRKGEASKAVAAAVGDGTEAGEGQAARSQRSTTCSDRRVAGRGLSAAG